MNLEKGAMERWRRGDPWGCFERYDPEASHFDTGMPARVNGREAMRAELAGLILR